MNKKCNWAICFLRRFFLCLKLDSRVKITPFNNAVQHRWLHSPYCINSLKLTEKQTNKPAFHVVGTAGVGRLRWSDVAGGRAWASLLSCSGCRAAFFTAS